MIGANNASLGPELLGPIAQVLGKPKLLVHTEKGLGLMLLNPTPYTIGRPNRVAPFINCGPANNGPK